MTKASDKVIGSTLQTPSGKALRKKAGKTIGVNGQDLMNKIWKD